MVIVLPTTILSNTCENKMYRSFLQFCFKSFFIYH